MNGKEKLPLLPGFVINKPKKNYHLPHRWNYINGTNIMVETEHKNQPDSNTIIHKSNLMPCSANRIPDWIVYDHKILRFTAYFREELQETYTATYQIRKVKILYHLEDGTIQVIEPRSDNSGISQGSIVSKQRVPRSKFIENEYLSVLDLNVQKNVKIFDRVYTITDCDSFTRKFLNEAGISVPDPIELPNDPTHVVRQRQKEEAKPTKPKMCHEEQNKLEKFLKYGTSCLKFTGFWDDQQSPSGHVHDLVLYFYLCDDTIQINEVDDQGKSSILLKRQKLPKKLDSLMVGQKSNFTVLNVLGRDFMKARYVQDRLNLGRPDIEYYMDSDLKIGETIDVLGRNVVLTDCDAFTKRYYFEKFGIEEFHPIERPKNIKSYQSITVEREIPPYNGWGSLADSEANCLSLMPKPPHRDMNKFLTLDRCNLRFQARMISSIPENGERNFIITYYLSDDTISVYEFAGRNSGFSSGDFFKRTKFNLPELNAYQRFYVGATIHLMGYDFKLIDADEFTLKYMETHPFEYPMSNISSIMSKIKGAITPIYKDFVAKYLGNVSTSTTTTSSPKQKLYICFNTMRKALIDLLGSEITDHEVLTFLRYFSVTKSSMRSKYYDRETVTALVEIELNRHLWNDFDNLKTMLYEMDPNCLNNYLSQHRLRSFIAGCRLPIKNDLLEAMFAILRKNDSGDLETNDFLRFIDECKRTSSAFELRNKCSSLEIGDSYPAHHQQLIDWSAFIDELGLEDQLRQGVE